MKKIIFCILVVFMFVIGCVPPGVLPPAPSPPSGERGDDLTGQAIVAVKGYSKPVNIFDDPNKEIFSISSDNVKKGDILKSMVSNNGGIIYNKGYYNFKKQDGTWSGWQEYTFDCNKVEGSNTWCDSSATGEITVMEGVEGMILAYPCKKYRQNVDGKYEMAGIKEIGKWKCGCSDENTCSQWSAQTFAISSGEDELPAEPEEPVEETEVVEEKKAEETITPTNIYQCITIKNLKKDMKQAFYPEGKNKDTDKTLLKISNLEKYKEVYRAEIQFFDKDEKQIGSSPFFEGQTYNVGGLLIVVPRIGVVDDMVSLDIEVCPEECRPYKKVGKGSVLLRLTQPEAYGIKVWIERSDQDGLISAMNTPCRAFNDLDVNDLDEGDYKIYVKEEDAKAKGYKPYEAIVKISADQVTTHEIKLIKPEEVGTLSITISSATRTPDGKITLGDSINDATVTMTHKDDPTQTFSKSSSPFFYYLFENLKPGKYTIVMSKTGYETYTTEWPVVAGQVRSLNPWLVKIS